MINKAAEIEAAYGRDTFARGLLGLNADNDPPIPSSRELEEPLNRQIR